MGIFKKLCWIFNGKNRCARCGRRLKKVVEFEGKKYGLGCANIIMPRPYKAIPSAKETEKTEA